MTKAEAIAALDKLTRKHARLVKSVHAYLDVKLGDAPEDYGHAEGRMVDVSGWGREARNRRARPSRALGMGVSDV